MSLKPTVAAVSFLFSSAHCWIAPSIWRRLLMQAFICEVVRALIKLGIAIAANRPIIATTIMISTNVKPDLRDVFLFILYFVFSLLRREQDSRRVSIISMRSLIACCNRRKLLAKQVPNMTKKAYAASKRD